MPFNFKKRLALKAIAAGMSLPEEPIDRIIELTHLKQLISLMDINCVLDVGANKGQFATELRGIGFKGLIVSFEPLQREFSRLRETFCRDPLWRGFQVALGETSGPAKINVIPYLTVMSSLLESTAKWRDVEIEEIEVKRLDDMFDTVVSDVASPRVLLKMDTLDALMNAHQISHCDYLKLDCEGAEHEIIAKMSQTTARHIAQITMEVHNVPGFEAKTLTHRLEILGYGRIGTSTLPFYAHSPENSNQQVRNRREI